MLWFIYSGWARIVGYLVCGLGLILMGSPHVA